MISKQRTYGTCAYSKSLHLPGPNCRDWRPESQVIVPQDTIAARLDNKIEDIENKVDKVLDKNGQ